MAYKSCRDNPGYGQTMALLALARSGKRTLIMGILNVTPDSFSDGGMFLSTDIAKSRALALIEQGADIIDIGGESTRPSTFHTNKPLPAEDEMRRILPVIERVHSHFPSVPISVDTYKSDVAAAALGAGATMINDISAMRAHTNMEDVVANTGAAVCLMHMAGLPTQVDPSPHYVDVVADIREHLLQRVKVAIAAGISSDCIVLDPGIGFGKTVAQNLEILRRQRELVSSQFPLMIGVSRKSTIGAVLGGLPPQDRLEGTCAAVAISVANGASIVRVHDVREIFRVVKMADAIVRGWNA